MNIRSKLRLASIALLIIWGIVNISLSAAITVEYSPSSLVSTVLPAPIIRKVLTNKNTVTLKWSAISGANSYNVYQGTAANREGLLPVQSGIKATTTIIKKLANNQQYFFKVAAVNISGAGKLSNEVSAIPLICNNNGVCDNGEKLTNCPNECPFLTNTGETHNQETLVNDHPRIWLNSKDLPRLQSWAVSSNPMYAKGLAQAAKVAADKYKFMFDANGQALPTWWDPTTGIDIGINGGYYATETLAALLAFHSMVAPIAQAETHAQMAHTILMHIINIAASCIDNQLPKLPSGLYPPFCDPYWMSGTANRLAVGGGDMIGLIVDWLKGYEQNRKKIDGTSVDPILSATDKDKIVRVFSKWADDSTHFIQEQHPWPMDIFNDPQLLLGTNSYRWISQSRTPANNYYLGRFRLMTFMTLAIDTQDSLTYNSSQFVTTYLDNILGAWLYQVYGMFEEAATVKKELLAPGADTTGMSLGFANGGLPVEGTMYGESQGYLFQTLLALHTAGYDNIETFGPQAGLIRSPYWDQAVTGTLHQLAPLFDTANHIWPIASYGDVYFTYLTSWDYLSLFGALGVYDQSIKRESLATLLNPGQDARINAVKWIILNGIENSDNPNNIYTIAGNAAGESGPTAAGNSPHARLAILLFMLFDPNEFPNTASATPPSNPRHDLTTTFISKPMNRILARTDWSANATWFTHLCQWISIAHQQGVCGEFEFWRKGEWLTKERSGYDTMGTPGIGMTCDYHNCLGIKNKAISPTDENGVPTKLSWFERPIWDLGGQWQIGQSTGDPRVMTSLQENYIYLRDDVTKLYNRVPNAQTGINAAEVTQAIRSLFWLKPDYIVIHDRTGTKSSGLFKHFNLTLVQGVDPLTHALLPPPTISATPPKVPALITQTTTHGQKMYVNALLPENADVKLELALNWPIALLARPEPTQMGPNNTPSGYHLQIEEPTAKNVNFLNVLQGADPGQASDPVTLIHSDADSADVFEGALIQSNPTKNPIGVTAVFFPVVDQAVQGLKATLPIRPNYIYAAGFTPNTVYSAGVDVNNVLAITPANTTDSSIISDSAGVLVLVLNPINLPKCTVELSPLSLSVGSVSNVANISVNLQEGCTWDALSNVPWITIAAGNNGSGNGTVLLNVAANTSSNARMGTVIVGGQIVNLIQAGATPSGGNCSYTLSIARKFMVAGASSKSVVLTTSSGCSWTASTDANWLTPTPLNGTSTGALQTVQFSATANNISTPRTATLTIAGQNVQITQAGNSGNGCIYSLGSEKNLDIPTGQSFSNLGGTSSISAMAPGGCVWKVSSDVAWINLTTTNFSGNGSVSFTVAPNNTGSVRIGHLIVAGQSYTVTQN